jgi:hypothetical protein
VHCLPIQYFRRLKTDTLLYWYQLATPEPKRCGKSYDQLRVNVHNPQCDFLASHDDYSLVERFHEQPKVVTMFRDPVARFLSSYEFGTYCAFPKS